jgi:hypothetical protein
MSILSFMVESQSLICSRHSVIIPKSKKCENKLMSNSFKDPHASVLMALAHALQSDHDNWTLPFPRQVDSISSTSHKWFLQLSYTYAVCH